MTNKTLGDNNAKYNALKDTIRDNKGFVQRISKQRNREMKENNKYKRNMRAEDNCELRIDLSPCNDYTV